MHFLKKLGCGTGSLVLKLSLLIFPLAFALVGVLGAPDHLKLALKESSIYDQIVDTGLESIATDQKTQSSQIDMGSPEVKQAAESAFPADTIELWGGQLVDGIYGWLDGKTEQPEFRIDTSAEQQAFVQNIADSVVQKVESLRSCTRQESLELSRQNIDLFNLPCRPPIDLASEKQRLINELTSSSNVLGDDNTITAEDITANIEMRDQFKNSPLPIAFQWSKRLPVIAAVIIATSTLVILWLGDDKRRSIKKISITLIGVGLVLIISTVLFSYILSQTSEPFSKLPSIGEGSLQTSVIEITKSLLNTFNVRVIIISLVYLVAAFVILLSLRFTRNPSTTAPRRFQ